MQRAAGPGQEYEVMLDPHQRCGYSDLPFAKKDTFLYCRVWKWVGGVWSRVCPSKMDEFRAQIIKIQVSPKG